jgi:hypothetical protein
MPQASSLQRRVQAAGERHQEDREGRCDNIEGQVKACFRCLVVMRTYVRREIQQKSNGGDIQQIP